MSLLDSPNFIEIVLYYKYDNTDHGKRLVIVANDKAQELLNDEEKAKEIDVLKTNWNILTWKEQNDVMNLSSQTINPQTGERQFNFLAYRDAIIKRCLKEWNLTVNEKPVPVSAQAIDQLPGAVVNNLYQQFEEIIDYTEKELGN